MLNTKEYFDLAKNYNQEDIEGIYAAMKLMKCYCKERKLVRGKKYPDQSMNTAYIAEAYFGLTAKDFNNLLDKIGFDYNTLTKRKNQYGKEYFVWKEKNLKTLVEFFKNNDFDFLY